MAESKQATTNLPAKARLLWSLVTGTAGVADLAEPMRRVERDFGRLSRFQKLTVGEIALRFEQGCHEIDAKASEAETKQELKAPPIEPDAVIPPGTEIEDKATES